jgi:MoaA/NifB/PqqE/SkfB family radical SAM enzyme
MREGNAGWKLSDMKLDEFRRLVPYFKDVRGVVLEGWGEALLYPGLLECVELVKATGAEPGFVTSGKGLTRSYAEDLVKAGVAFIGFSLAGASAEVHNSIRINSDFDELLRNIRELQQIKTSGHMQKPRLHIVYLMLRNNVHEIPQLIFLAKRLGIDQVVLINIIQVMNPWQDSEKAFTCENGFLNRHIMGNALALARKLKVRLSAPALQPQDVAVCSENPLDNLYVSVDGEVTPCVYLCPPVPAPFKGSFAATNIPQKS